MRMWRFEVSKAGVPKSDVMVVTKDDMINVLAFKSTMCCIESLVTNTMWRNLILQALYQITVSLTIQFKKSSTFRVDERAKKTDIQCICVVRDT
ncbi:Calcium-transporting ATPase 12, plasma membrane-type [Acorus calamus]|uniref:Calcium-transporting ATPase 12, plasma membrane-type n=1 Tax=Acorus calamus TaxID=4465 RepID=A0AAV9EI63_ACOCL|nr:Calcium-transporting ATPase 12, plasma membrane-type [Acorus calamus]